MKPTLLKVAAIHFLAASMSLTTVLADFVIKDLEFNVDGVLPSAESNIEFFNNTGHSESSLYSVTLGFLHQSTASVDGDPSYSFPNNSLTGGGIDSSLATRMEVRLQVTAITGDGAFFQFFDGAHRYTTFLQPSGVSVLTTSGYEFAAVDVTQLHAYSLESVANTNTLNLFVDGALLMTTTAPTNTSLNGFNWGDGISPAGNGANVDWDYVRVTQFVPEPSSALLGGIGLACMMFRRIRYGRNA